MQTLKEKLKEDLKVALKNGNSLKKDLIRMILSEVSLEEGRGAVGFLLNDEGVLSVIKKLKKSQEINKEGYEKLQKELPENLIKEIEILNSYLPQQMEEEEIKRIVSELISEVGAESMKDVGKVMSAFNSKYAGKADNKIVSTAVKDCLTNV